MNSIDNTFEEVKAHHTEHAPCEDIWIREGSHEEVMRSRCESLASYARAHQHREGFGYNEVIDAMTEVIAEVLPPMAVTFEEMQDLRRLRGWHWFYYPSILQRDEGDEGSDEVRIITPSAPSEAALMAQAGYRVTYVDDTIFIIDGMVEPRALPYEAYGEQGYRIR